MEFNEAENYVNSLGMFSKVPTLKRMEDAVKAFNCKNEFPIIHIAGTNGKGSVCCMCAEALKSAGYKTGLYISPHITDICERIQINGNFIEREDFARITELIKASNIALTEFEFLTLIALIYFKEQKVDVAVIETGLGGRLDATNVMKNKLVSVITKIGLDHTAILGDTTDKIAAEKCGIIKGGKAISNPCQPNGVLEIIKKHSSKVYMPDMSALSVIKSDIFGNEFTYKGENYITGMSGTYQIENAVTAIETLKNCGLDISEDDIKRGVKKGFMFARMQIISKNPLIIVDGAHNPDGAKSLVSILEKTAPVTAIVGVMRDKNYDELLKTTLKYAQKTICVKPCDYGRALDGAVLAKTAEKYCADVCFTDSHKAALKTAKKEDNPIFIFGSLYLAAEFLKIL